MDGQAAARQIPGGSGCLGGRGRVTVAAQGARARGNAPFGGRCGEKQPPVPPAQPLLLWQDICCVGGGGGGGHERSPLQWGLLPDSGMDASPCRTHPTPPHPWQVWDAGSQRDFQSRARKRSPREEPGHASSWQGSPLSSASIYPSELCQGPGGASSEEGPGSCPQPPREACLRVLLPHRAG